MKSITEDEVKGKFNELKGKTKVELGKLMNDPTLEGKDENKVGRVQRKTARRNGFPNTSTNAIPSRIVHSSKSGG